MHFISGWNRGFRVFAHTAFDQQAGQQQRGARHDGQNRLLETLTSAALGIHLKNGRNLEGI